MDIPRWNDPDLTAGSMVLGALWLVQEVGVGNTFTKTRLREAFPRVGQIDRRVRDLRDYEWVLHSSTEDARLRPDEQRLVHVGVPVWDPAARKTAAPKSAISSKLRAAVLRRDDYMCVTCGVSAGDNYPDGGHETASIGVVRRPTADDGDQTVLITQCRRCASGGTDETLSRDEALQRIAALDPRQRETLLDWMAMGRRATSPLLRAWSAYRRLPADTRDAVEALMRPSSPGSQTRL